LVHSLVALTDGANSEKTAQGTLLFPDAAGTTGRGAGFQANPNFCIAAQV
jgi:hypothetical protein